MNKNKFKQQFSFNDFDAYAEMVNQASLENAQIDVGKFEGSLTQVVYGPIILSLHRMNKTILQEGVGVNGYTTFLIPGNMEQNFIWRKHRLSGNIIGILTSGSEHSCISLPNFFGTPVSIANDYLLEISDILGYPNLLKFLRQKEVVNIDIHKAKQIHNLVIYLCNSNNYDESLSLYHLPRLIISSIGERLKEDKIVNSGSRNIILRNAQDYIFDHIDDSINILKLCKAVGASERNLRYIFKEKIGVSPNMFVRSVKLNRVRKLIKSNDQKEMISTLANQLGFWHSGQFAKDYKRLFGELPSESSSLKESF